MASSMAVMPRDQMSACNSKAQPVTHSGEAVQRNTLPRREKKNPPCAFEVLNKILILN